MKFKQHTLLFFLLALLILGCNDSEEYKREQKTKRSDSYVLVSDWPNLPSDFILGNPTGLGINSENNIVVFHRASRVWQEPMPEDKIQENTITVIDKETGNVLNSWGANLFIMPH